MDRLARVLVGGQCGTAAGERQVEIGLELLGIDGAMMIDDDHLNHLLYSEKGVAHAYIPGHSEDMVFLGSTTPGDWAAGDFWGPMANETRAWLDHLSTGSATVQTTPQQARLNLEVPAALHDLTATPVRGDLDLDDELDDDEDDVDDLDNDDDTSEFTDVDNTDELMAELEQFLRDQGNEQ
mgnify:CR=1 FL=1